MPLSLLPRSARVHQADWLLWIFAEPVRYPLALVINEVVANAVEHGLDGETGTVTLEGIRGTNDEGENILTVVITDDGKGMGDKKIEESDRTPTAR